MIKTTILRASVALCLLSFAALGLLRPARVDAQMSFGKIERSSQRNPKAPELDDVEKEVFNVGAKNAKTQKTSKETPEEKNESSSRARVAIRKPSVADENAPAPEQEDDAVEETAKKPAKNALSSGSKTTEKRDAKGKDAATGKNGPTLGAPVVHRYRAGMIFQAQAGGACSNVFGSAPVPMDFPEQKVETIEEVFPRVARVDYRDLKEGGARQLIFKMRELKSGQSVEATALFKVTRYPILAPNDPSIYLVPKQVPQDIKRYLKEGKYMQSNSKTVRTLAKETTKEKETAWEKVDAILAFVRENIQYKEVLVQKQMRGALDALKTRDGDCEDMSALFIAMCRAIDVPARLVRVPGHCWAEFYLVDDEKNGYWFPAQVAGNDKLGDRQDTRGILQKGDAFRLPESPREEDLYVKELFTGKVKENGPDPIHQFIQEVDGE